VLTSKKFLDLLFYVSEACLCGTPIPIPTDLYSSDNNNHASGNMILVVFFLFKKSFYVFRDMSKNKKKSFILV